MPVPGAGPAVAEPDASGPAEEGPQAADDVPVPTRIVGSRPCSVAAVLRYVADADINLVVADTPADRGPVPPLAAEVSRALIHRLDCPVFVVEQQGDPDAIQRILVPTDFSDRALQAFRYAVVLARLYEASIDVLHVVDSLPYVALTPMDRLSLGVVTLSECRARNRVHAFLEGEEPADAQVRSHILHGNAADQISRFADGADADLMVLATHGADERTTDPFGSVGTRVLGRVTCPFVLLPETEPSVLGPPGGAA